MAKFDSEAELKYKGQYRPEFTKIVELIEAGRVKYLVVSDVTRIARPLNELLQAFLAILFKKHNVLIISAKDGIIDYSDFTHNIVQYMSQNVKRQEINKNHSLSTITKNKLKNNGCMTFHVYYGYATNQGKQLITLPDGTTTKTSIVKIDESKANVVRLIFDKYIAGESIFSIQKYLELNGIETKSRKKKWHNTSVLEIIKNIHYSGMYLATDGSYKPSPTIPAIISYDTWIKAQSTKHVSSSYSKKSNSRKVDNSFPLSGGLVRCACGCNLVGIKTNNNNKAKEKHYTAYYRCASFACKNRAYIKASELHNLVKIIIDDKDDILRWKEATDGKNKEFFEAIEKLKLEIAKDEKRIAEYETVYLDSPVELRKYTDKFNKAIKDKQTAITELQAKIINDYPINGNFQTQARFLLKSIIVTKNKSVLLETLTYRFGILAKKNKGKAGVNFLLDKEDMHNLRNGLHFDEINMMNITEREGTAI